MDRRSEIRDFLTTRRARITPEQAGLTPSPLAGARRVPGLRREEVAQLAGVSVPYYTQLERGDARGATDAVLDAIAGALQLDDAERADLFDLRAEVGRNLHDKALSDLIGELSTRGDTFDRRWARHEVRRHRAGAKRITHPLVGDMTFNYETMHLTADEGLYVIICGVAAGSRDAEALNLLASWNTTTTTSPSST
jgi:transcriptional regulator with XRE-family HTH domain